MGKSNKYDGGEAYNILASRENPIINKYVDKVKSLLVNRKELNNQNIKKFVRKKNERNEKINSNLSLYTRLGSLLTEEELDLISNKDASEIVWRGISKYTTTDYIQTAIFLINDHVFSERVLGDDFDYSNKIEGIVDDVVYYITPYGMYVFCFFINKTIIPLCDATIDFRRVITDQHLKLHITHCMKDLYNNTMERVRDAILYKKPLHKKKKFLDLNRVVQLAINQ